MPRLPAEIIAVEPDRIVVKLLRNAHMSELALLGASGIPLEIHTDGYKLTGSEGELFPLGGFAARAQRIPNKK
jgi:hypothetical protein